MSCPEIVRHARSFSPELGWAIEAAAAAGKIIKDGVGQLHPFAQKGVGDLVSEVDRRADEMVTETLQKYSQIPILSEELSPDVGEQSDLWIVDPLDATNAYLMRAGDQYPSVLIARYQDGKTQLGVVHFPLTGEWFYAQDGCCAWKNGQRLQTKKLPEPSLTHSWVELNQYGDEALETEDFAQLRQRLRSQDGASLVTATVPNSGVALRIAESNTGLVAAIHDNRADHVKQAAWDIAAPQLILQEAGGVFVNLKGEPTNPFRPEVTIVARNKNVALDVIALADSIAAVG